MKKIEYKSQVTSLQIDELSKDERKAMDMAVQMLEKAYAPYSNFHVGAAVMTQSGKFYAGCNQENASYPLCICGERVALYNAGTYEHDIPVTLLAVVARSPDKPIQKPVSPCGACRQVISEFQDRHDHKITILLKGDTDEIYKLNSADELLPFLFDGSYL